MPFIGKRALYSTIHSKAHNEPKRCQGPEPHSFGFYSVLNESVRGNKLNMHKWPANPANNQTVMSFLTFQHTTVVKSAKSLLTVSGCSGTVPVSASRYPHAAAKDL